MGQKVRATARVETADESAALFAFATTDRPTAPLPMVSSFLERAPSREATILPDFDPRRGQVLQVSGLLLTREKAESPTVVRVTVTAF